MCGIIWQLKCFLKNIHLGTDTSWVRDPCWHPICFSACSLVGPFDQYLVSYWISSGVDICSWFSVCHPCWCPVWSPAGNQTSQSVICFNAQPDLQLTASGLASQVLPQTVCSTVFGTIWSWHGLIHKSVECPRQDQGPSSNGSGSQKTNKSLVNCKLIEWIVWLEAVGLLYQIHEQRCLVDKVLHLSLGQIDDFKLISLVW